ncbi:ESX-1 secretion-associated protein [Mycobacterium sp. 21AC1]|uniref:ESX-1 secretion-associated protein n=1 Tax=[Mycobacterium] appelbergii TaxID=2939269 RepID=UPI0029394B65|nr:ESX-1 secretion-associated protein [Mycobacterium sp. 21AC1]MDV3129516.1 ESX-1 secretion-associated protein [Mycobacterium sp. 21AC1]
MSDLLKVHTTHVRDLSERQNQAASQVASASGTPQGVPDSVAVNHGLVCGAAITALTMALAARTQACARMQHASTDLSQKLNIAASRYDQADAKLSGKLNATMHPG